MGIIPQIHLGYTPKNMSVRWLGRVAGSMGGRPPVGSCDRQRVDFGTCFGVPSTRSAVHALMLVTTKGIRSLALAAIKYITLWSAPVARSFSVVSGSRHLDCSNQLPEFARFRPC